MNPFLSDREKRSEKAMTKEDKLKMMEMRLDGYTLNEIGEHFAISSQRVSQLFKEMLAEKKNEAANKIIYPGLKKWMLENRITVCRMNTELGMTKNHNHFMNILSGKGKLTIDYIKAIIKYTGCSFEELFGGESE